MIALGSDGGGLGGVTRSSSGGEGRRHSLEIWVVFVLFFSFLFALFAVHSDFTDWIWKINDTRKYNDSTHYHYCTP